MSCIVPCEDWLAGHEQAFRQLGDVTNTALVDSAKATVLTHTRETLAFDSTYADVCGDDGVRPHACQPNRPPTKGNVESGVTYAVRNALAGKRFHSCAHLNSRLVEWATTLADQREHETTHEIPALRVVREALTPLDGRLKDVLPHARERKVTTDGLVTIDGARDSVLAAVNRPRCASSRSVDVVESLRYGAHYPVVLVDRHAVGAAITVLIEPPLERTTGSIRPGDGFRRAIAVTIGHADSDGVVAEPLAYVILSFPATVDHTPDHFWQ